MKAEQTLEGPGQRRAACNIEDRKQEPEREKPFYAMILMTATPPPNPNPEPHL